MKKIVLAFCALVLLSMPLLASAQETISVSAAQIAPRSEVFFEPASGTFAQGTVFEVPIYLNTRGNKINAVELHVRYDANKLRIVSPSGGSSIVGLWIAPPSYDNERGTLDLTGTIPGGITTRSGLIVTITFQAKATGQALVSIAEGGKVLLNDGLGSPTEVLSSRASFTILPKAPEGPHVVSETHPFSDRWYNNPHPVVRLMSEGVFSYVFDTIPTTIPTSTTVATSTTIAFENVGDGEWYFHVRERSHGVWGATTHFLIRVDSTPPALFTPTVEELRGTSGARFLVSFFTTDSLSGLDHYEIGAIDNGASSTTSPVFVAAQSPYQLPVRAGGEQTIFVRAFDKAGNVREAARIVSPTVSPDEYTDVGTFMSMHATSIVIVTLLGIIVALGLHFVFGHHLVLRFGRGMELAKLEEEKEVAAQRMQ